MLIDTHAHLDDKAYQDDFEAVLQRAGEQGVQKIVTIGTDVESSERAVAIADKYEGVSAAIGCHPHEADRYKESAELEQLRGLLGAKKVVAFGETGLDYYKKLSTPEAQRALFLFHIQLAQEGGKPLVIHCREAHRECREIVRSEMPLPMRGVVHCFSGTADDAKEYLDMGLYISIAGPITFPNARGLREVTKTVPLDRLLVETDAPYLAPQAFRGKRNEPSYVRFTAQVLAELLNVDFERFAEQTTKNAGALFGI